MASIRKRKTSEGTKYTVLYDYTDNQGVRKQRSAGTFDSKAQAETVKLDIDLKKRRNKMVDPSKETVREFIYRWLPIRAKLKKWEYSYLSTATMLLEKHVIPEIGDVPMQTVSPMHIDNLFSKLQEKRCGGPKSYHKAEEEIPFLSGSTLASIYTLVKCFFDAAVTWKLIEENPVTLDKPASGDKDDIVIWDLNMILLALENISDAQLHLMVHIAAALTCRNGEVCGLTWDCVNLNDGVMKIDKTIQRISKKSFKQLPQKEVYRIFPDKTENAKSILVLKTPKTKGSVRWLYLTKPLVEELRRRKQQVAKEKLFCGADYHDYGLVFCQEDGTPVAPNLCEKWFRKWQIRHADLGLPKIVFHGLRHSATTLLMYLSGSDAKTVQTITGHGSAKFVFDVYNHPLMSKQKLLVEKLERVMYHDESNDVPLGQTISASASAEAILQAIKKDPLLAQEVFSALHAPGAGIAKKLAR